MEYQKAQNVLQKYMQKPNLVKHSVAVAEVMRHFARLAGEDEDYWAAVGLLHDVDYELYPELMHAKSPEILKNEGYDDKFIYSVQSHAWGLCGDCEPKKPMELVLASIDQLTGFIIAVALMKPDKKLASVEMSSLLKKWKDKKFASGTGRDRIVSLCERMGKEFSWVLEQTLLAMQNVADKLGL